MNSGSVNVLFLAMILLLWYHPILAAQDFLPTAIPVSTPDGELIGTFIYYWENNGQASIESVHEIFRSGDFTPLNANLFNKGYTESIWWFGFVLENILDEKNKVIFSPVGAAIKEGILYTFDEEGVLVNEQYSGFLFSGKKEI